jgi:membrane protein DedA with SNARE-associated domain
MDILQSLFQYFAQNKYLVIFIGTIIGGETVLLAAGFLASLGYLNIFLVVLVGGGGEIIADLIWYWIGNLNDKRFIKKYGKYFFLNVQRIEQLKEFFTKHGGKTLMMAKFMYGIRTPILLIAGMAKMNFARFLLFNTLAIFILAVLFTLLGYLFGHSLVSLDQYTVYVGIFMTIILLSILIVTFYLRKKAGEKIDQSQ